MTITSNKAKLPALLLYIMALSLAAMYTVNFRHYVICALIMAFTGSGLVLAISGCRRKLASQLVVIIGVALFVGTVLVFTFMGNDNASFLRYMFSGSSIGFDWTWALASALIFGLIVGFVCYYFAIHCNGSASVIMAAYVVVVLAGRTLGALPLWIVIFTAASYILLVASSGNVSYEYRFPISIAGVRYACAAAITVVALIVAAIIPKSVAMGGKELINQLMWGDGGYGSGLSDFAESSSVNTGINEPAGNELFRVSADEPQNLVRWAFDQYNGEEGWTALEYYNSGYPDWGYSDAHIGNMINRMREAAADGMLNAYADRLAEIPEAVEGYTEMGFRYTALGASRVIIHPMGTYHAEITSGEAMPDRLRKIYRTDRDELFAGGDHTAMEYTVYSFSTDINVPFVREFNEEAELRDLLIAASNEGVISQNAVDMFIKEMSFAKYYQQVTETKGVSDRIKSLAEEITAGADNDYDKLIKIMRWFEHEDFVYDMEFVPKEYTAEYFLFNSKRGICSDFATAATLLCRGAGLTAIYTEGFVMDEKSKIEDIYIITDAQAHAFSQVYIKGHGWVCLDATAFAESAEELVFPWGVIVTIAAVAVFLLAMLIAVYLMRRQLADVWFAVTYRTMSADAAMRGVLIRIRREAARLSGFSADTMSANDIVRLLHSYGLSEQAAHFSASCDRALYGGYIADRAEINILYEDYRILKSIRRVKR